MEKVSEEEGKIRGTKTNESAKSIKAFYNRLKLPPVNLLHCSYLPKKYRKRRFSLI